MSKNYFILKIKKLIEAEIDDRITVDIVETDESDNKVSISISNNGYKCTLDTSMLSIGLPEISEFYVLQVLHIHFIYNNKHNNMTKAECKINAKIMGELFIKFTKCLQSVFKYVIFMSVGNGKVKDDLSSLGFTKIHNEDIDSLRKYIHDTHAKFPLDLLLSIDRGDDSSIDSDIVHMWSARALTMHEVREKHKKAREYLELKRKEHAEKSQEEICKKCNELRYITGGNING